MQSLGVAIMELDGLLSGRLAARFGGRDTVPMGYTWRYLDHSGRDVTVEVTKAGMVVDRVEAYDAKSGLVLLRMQRAGLVWRVCVPSGHFGDQLDGADLVREYGSPFEAMQVAALRLGMVAAEI